MSATDVPAPVRATSASPSRAEWERRTNSFTGLAQQVRSAGLNGRTTWFYITLFAGLVVGLAGAVTGMILLGDSWYQPLIAAGLGVLFTQFAFIGHEAAHRQVFAAGPANDRFARLLATGFVGISLGCRLSTSPFVPITTTLL